MGIREVAKIASVSTATVSRMITGAARVAPATADRVLRAIRVLNFQPNEAARALRAIRVLNFQPNEAARALAFQKKRKSKTRRARRKKLGP